MRLRRDDVCCACTGALVKGTEAYWDADARTVTCLGCLPTSPETNASSPPQPVVPRSERTADPAPQPELDRGRPGASAAREHRRRRANREARTRRRHPLLGGLLLAMSNSPQHESAWQTGRRGEEQVGLSLERRTANGPAMILHDRRMPGGYGNIDHLAIAPRGVFVIDAKAVKGKVRIAQSLFGKPKLMIAGRNRTKLVDGLDRQVDAVRRALVEDGCGDVPVHGVLCFTKADLPLLRPCQIRGHRLHYCRATARKLNRSGHYGRDVIDQIARRLAVAFPPA
jgi:hypothetical protein